MKTANNNSYHKLPILDGLELLNAKRHTLDFPFHTHNTFNITLVLDQVFSTKLPDRLLRASMNAIVITNPDEVHATICDNKLGSSFFTFYVSPEVLKDLNKNKPVMFYDKIINDNFLFQQLYTLSKEIYSSKNDIEQKLLHALKQLVNRYSEDTTTPENKKRLFHSFLEETDLEKFSLENTASKFGLDKFKFLRLFKQETGLTPNNYIILKRIEKCKELLQTQDDLLDIAIQTGFYDATHLCKYFKKITGITPLAYRYA
jgi:AraC-like DNA-binding protein